MDAQNTETKKLVVYAKLVDLAYDTNDYLTYVFKILDEEDINILGSRYLMCTQYPNWNHRLLNIGEIGFLSFEEILRGKTEWYDGHKFIPHNYDHFHFIKFVSKKEQMDEIVV